MKVYLWNDTLKVGVAEVDQQHKDILAALRELQLGLYDKLSREEVAEKLVQINHYRGEHFATEERLMEPYKDQLPSYNEHIEAHKTFSDTIDDFLVRFEKGDVEVTMQLYEFLGQWLNVHITGLDKRMGKELRQLNAPYFDEK